MEEGGFFFAMVVEHNSVELPNKVQVVQYSTRLAQAVSLLKKAHLVYPSLFPDWHSLTQSLTRYSALSAL